MLNEKCRGHLLKVAGSLFTPVFKDNGKGKGREDMQCFG